MSKTKLDEIEERWVEERKARKAGKRSFDFDKKATEDIAYLLQRVEELEGELRKIVSRGRYACDWEGLGYECEAFLMAEKILKGDEDED